MQTTVEIPSRVCERHRRAPVGVRTRSGSDGIIHSSCALIGSLPLAVLTQRCARTVELTRRREFNQASPDESSYETRYRRSRPMITFGRAARSAAFSDQEASMPATSQCLAQAQPTSIGGSLG